MTERIQRKRTKGWRMPPNTVYVGRPSKWGNPFAYSREVTLYKSLEKFQEWLSEKLANDPHFLDPLKGKNLACWCPVGRTCHADILLELALSKEEMEKREWFRQEVRRLNRLNGKRSRTPEDG